MISSEIEELIGLCDRILVMSRGELRGSFARAEFDREAILRAALRAGDRLMRPTRPGLAVALLRAAPLLLFLVAVLAFGLRAPRFLTIDNAVNILVQSSAIAIVATGMTFVLLTAGIDLSVGSIMFLGAVAAGKLTLEGGRPGWRWRSSRWSGLACGAVNALFITRLRMMPFIVTLATLFIGRGLGLYITQTRAMNLPEEFLRVGSAAGVSASRCRSS